MKLLFRQYENWDAYEIYEKGDLFLGRSELQDYQSKYCGFYDPKPKGFWQKWHKKNNAKIDKFIKEIEVYDGQKKHK